MSKNNTQTSINISTVTPKTIKQKKKKASVSRSLHHSLVNKSTDRSHTFHGLTKRDNSKIVAKRDCSCDHKTGPERRFLQDD